MHEEICFYLAFYHNSYSNLHSFIILIQIGKIYKINIYKILKKK